MNSKEYEYKNLPIRYLTLGSYLEDLVCESFLRLLTRYGLPLSLAKRAVFKNHIVGSGSDLVVDLCRTAEVECKNWNGSYYLTPSNCRREVLSRFSSRASIKLLIISSVRMSRRVKMLLKKYRVFVIFTHYQILDYLEDADEYLVLSCRDHKISRVKKNELVEYIVRLLKKCSHLVKIAQELALSFIKHVLAGEMFNYQLKLVLITKYSDDTAYG